MGGGNLCVPDKAVTLVLVDNKVVKVLFDLKVISGTDVEWYIHIGRG